MATSLAQNTSQKYPSALQVLVLFVYFQYKICQREQPLSRVVVPGTPGSKKEMCHGCPEPFGHCQP